MGRKAGWARPFPSGRSSPCHPSDSLRAAQTQLAASPPPSLLLSPSALPPLSPALESVVLPAPWRQGLREAPAQAPSRRAGLHGGRLEAPPVVPCGPRTRDSSGGDAGPSACPLPPSAGALRNSKALWGQKRAEDPPGSPSVSPRRGLWGRWDGPVACTGHCCVPAPRGSARTHRGQEKRQQRQQA